MNVIPHCPAPKPIIGMLHLPPLSGSPRASQPLSAIIAHAVRDADALAAGGVHALMLENFGDVPFFPGTSTTAISFLNLPDFTASCACRYDSCE